ncbi:S8 family serine peptidase [Bacillus sp. AK128]
MRSLILTLILLLVTPGIVPSLHVKALETIDRLDLKVENNKIEDNQLIDVDDIYDRRILIKLKNQVELDYKKISLIEISLSERLREKGYRVVQVPNHLSFLTKLEEIKALEEVEFAEPEYLNEIMYTPKDPYYSHQWYLPKINMSQAWDLMKGSSTTIVAVLDTGINSSHPDLSGRILPGYDFVNKDSNPSDDHGHGTHVAGIIAANANSIGITGIDFSAKILPVKVANHEGLLSTSNIIEGIYYAIDQGAHIINMSYGSTARSELEENALKEAYSKGITLIAASGNDGSSTIHFPAAYPYVISVGATDKLGKRAGFSNYGELIDLSSPGVDIVSTNFKGGYVSGEGTSYSAPIVSGIAALLKAKNPMWGPNEITWALQKGASAVSREEWNGSTGFGIVNAYQSLLLTVPDRSNDISDEKSAAHVLDRGSIQQDKIDFPFDVDWFKLNVDNGSEVSIELSGYPLEMDAVFVNEEGAVIPNHLLTLSTTGSTKLFTYYTESPIYVGLFDKYGHWSEKHYSIKYQMPLSLNQGINQGDRMISGIADPHSVVYINKIGGNSGILGSTVVNNDGTFSVVIPPQMAGNTIEVYTINDLGHQSDKKTLIVKSANAITFKDVTDYKDEISFLAGLNIIKGYQDSTFKPTQPVKRLQAVQMILREMGLTQVEPTLQPSYSDLKPGDYGYREVALATEMGFIQGKDNGSFDPYGYLTRAQMAKILSVAYTLPKQKGTVSTFSDTPGDFWGLDYINSLQHAGITTGYEDGTFRPTTTISRQHFVLFMTRYIDNSHNLN